MNQEQVKSAVRWLVSTFGAAFAGFFVGKGWFTAEQVLEFLNSEVFMSVVVSLVGLIWGFFVHTRTNAVAVVKDIPEVAGVVTAPTPAGVALASAVPGDSVAPAGTRQAATIAKV